MEVLRYGNYKKIYAVSSFQKEYDDLFRKDADSNTYYKKFRSSLAYLESVPSIQKAIQHKNFEQLKNSKNLYAIRHISTLNPRTIFFYAIEKDIYILLHTFFEKNTRDYDRAIEKAENILKKIEMISERGNPCEYPEFN